MSVEVEHPAFGVLRQAGIPIRFAATPGAIRSAPPTLGEHTDEVLAEAGFDAAEIAGATRSRGSSRSGLPDRLCRPACDRVEAVPAAARLGPP